MNDARADIIALSEYVFQRTRGRLDGLTDSEYFWEPVPGCWTLRRLDSGAYRSDWNPRPERLLPHAIEASQRGLADDDGRPAEDSLAVSPPFTTIAWRMWHLICLYAGTVTPQRLGLERSPGGFSRSDPAPATAAEAIAVLDRAHAIWQDRLAELPAAAWQEPIAAGPFAGGSKASLVLHLVDEQIHHGAELGILRDLYLHDPTATP